MRNPCRECIHLQDSKNLPVCMACQKRVAYVRGLGSEVDTAAMIGSEGGGGQAPAVGGDWESGHKEHAEIRTKKNVGADLRAARKESDMEGQASYGQTKICRCEVCRTINPAGVEKPIGDFGKRDHCKDGLNPICRRGHSWSVTKCRLIKQGVKDPKPQDYFKPRVALKDLSGGGSRKNNTPLNPPSKGEPKKGAREETAEKGIAISSMPIDMKPGSIVLVIDLSGRPDLYHRLAERQAFEIIRKALEV